MEDHKLELLTIETNGMGVYNCCGKKKRVISVLNFMYIMDLAMMAFEVISSILLNLILFPTTVKNIAFLFFYPLPFIPFIIIQNVNLANLKRLESGKKSFIRNLKKVSNEAKCWNKTRVAIFIAQVFYCVFRIVTLCYVLSWQKLDKYTITRNDKQRIAGMVSIYVLTIIFWALSVLLSWAVNHSITKLQIFTETIVIS